MLTQRKADELLSQKKEALRRDVFTWLENTRQEEMVTAVQMQELEYLLSLKRNPFEITAQLRTRDRHIGLARIDNAAQHINPDGGVLRCPHLHVYREGEGLAWAEPADWYQVDQPMQTLLRFLEVISTRFPYGIQEALL